LTPLPAALGGAGLIVWRIETTKHLASWDSAEGAFLFGGRWSSAGRRVIYTSVDPSTAIAEVGVHKGFNTLDAVPHTLLALTITDPSRVHVLDAASVPNPSWLRPGAVSAEQQAFGDALLAQHDLVVVPSVVSPHSWNLLIKVTRVTDATGLFNMHHSERFALDPRLNPPAKATSNVGAVERAMKGTKAVLRKSAEARRKKI
jgi:RES domain-containing protein